MNLKRYYLDTEKSLEVYQEVPSVVIAKQCYNNIFNLVSRSSRVCNMIQSKKWKIAYGYMRAVKDNVIFVRHCFLLDENNQVIDPTLACLDKLDSFDVDYLVTFTYESISAYTDAIFENNLFPELAKLRFQEWNEFEALMIQDGLIPIN